MEQNEIIKVSQDVQKAYGESHGDIALDTPDKIFSFGEEATKGCIAFCG